MTKTAENIGGREGGLDGGNNVDRLTDIGKRTGVKDGEIETFITKVDAVNAAIQAMKDGTLDPSEVHVEGVPTLEEERQIDEAKRRRRLDMKRSERENRERKKREEHCKWWTGAELLYGSRVPFVPPNDPNDDHEGTHCGGARNGDTASQVSLSTTILTDEDKSRLKERYSLAYSRWDKWTPQDPATLSEAKEREEEEEQKKSRYFEENNAEFCSKMIDDMKIRSEAREKKENDANAARLKGNRFYKVKHWEKALELYMISLRAAPYAVNTLANVAQALIKLERWVEAVDFCERALHVHPGCVKALSRRATACLKLSALRSSWPSTDITPAAIKNIYSPSSEVGANCTVKNAEASNGASSTVQSEKINTSEGQGQGIELLWERYGGRDVLKELALSDLEKAMKIDPEGEDIRRQRDQLKREIEEEKVEGEVMQRARKITPPRAVAGNDHQTSDDRITDYDDGNAVVSVGEAKKRSKASNEMLELSQDSLKSCDEFDISQGQVKRRGSPPERHKKQPVSNGSGGAWSALGEDDKIMTVDKLLDESLCESTADGEGNANAAKIANDSSDFLGIGMLLDPLLRLTALLESSSTARVYLRASGGLARLATAAAAAATATATVASDPAPAPAPATAPTSDNTKLPRIKERKYENLAENEILAPNTVVGSTSGAEPSAITTGSVGSFNGATSAGHCRVVGAGSRRFGALLSAVAAAMCGGERLAQQEVWRSGLLDGCDRALQDACHFKDDPSEMGTSSKERLAGIWGTAGAAAIVIWNVADDVEVRGHVARNTSLLSGLVGLIAAKSAAPLAVQAAAETLRGALLGKTALTATKSLRSMAAAVRGASADMFSDGRGRMESPAAILGEALQAWRNRTGRMQDASVEVGEALCGALANLALYADFRGSFADLISRRSVGARDSVTSSQAAAEDTSPITTATVLVLMAGDGKEVDRSEARSLALAGLMNACLHTRSAQAATFSAGGLALALAFLSLEGKERSQNVPPLVAARSAGLLARLSSYLPALKAMARPAVIERIMKAIVRSASLGGNIYSTSDSPPPTTKSIPTSPDAATRTAASIERENLVRTLATVLRFPLVVKRVHSERTSGAGVPAPSSSVHGGTGEFLWHAAKAAEQYGLTRALIEFLPPAREDGVEGVTKTSVALMPEWSAPPALTANVCGCLLHLLGASGAGTNVVNQVVKVGGIPRLISLFANSGESASLMVRKNVAICLAKLARQPSNKKIITDLRGIEMLLQAGSGLDV